MSLPPTSPSATGTPSGLAAPDRNVLRSELIRARKALDPAEWESHSAAVQRRVLALPEWRDARTVAMYIAVRNEISTDEIIRRAWADIEMSHIDNYSFMPQTSDFSNEEFAQIAQAGADFFTKANVALSFFDTALATADLEILDTLEENPHFSAAIRQAKIQKSHFISPEVEKALTNLGEVFKAPEDIYTKMRAGDFEMEDFEVDGKVYQNSFVTYENFYQNHENAQVREKAFRSFSAGLRKHQNAAASAYLAQVKSEKIIADMRGYDSVFDYLLAEQEVNRDMFDRQIDLIMTEFAPVAQKYLKHVAQVNGLKKMTFADWKLDLDSELNPEVTIDDAYDLVMKSVAPLGNEYAQEVSRYQEERWVDFAANANKDSGGYATDPYKVHPYVLMSWTGRMSDV